MTLELEDLSRIIYLEQSGALAERIDYAWSVYIDKGVDEDYRRRALQFLIYAFDIHIDNFEIPETINFELILLMDDSTTEIVHQKISQRMTERETWKALVPEYIPGKTPEKIRQLITTQHAHSQQTLEDRLKNELLHVNDESKRVDIKYRTKFLTAYERNPMQVHIRGGLFYQDASIFDSRRHIAHNKQRFSAFTLNFNGELSVFQHLNMSNQIAHSSINAGAPVFYAGEFCVEKGKLKAVTTHSGHYVPNMSSMYFFLEHLTQRGVDISETKILMFKDPSLTHPIASKRHPKYSRLFEVNAEDIYKNYKQVLSNSIDTIHQTLTDIYQDRDKKSRPQWLSKITSGTSKKSDLKSSKKNFEQDLLSSLQWIKSELIHNRIDLDQAIRLLSYTVDSAKAQHMHLYTKAKEASSLAVISKTIDSFKDSLRLLDQEKNTHEADKITTLDALKKMF